MDDKRKTQISDIVTLIREDALDADAIIDTILGLSARVAELEAGQVVKPQELARKLLDQCFTDSYFPDGWMGNYRLPRFFMSDLRKIAESKVVGTTPTTPPTDAIAKAVEAERERVYRLIADIMISNERNLTYSELIAAIRARGGE